MHVPQNKVSVWDIFCSVCHIFADNVLWLSSGTQVCAGWTLRFTHQYGWREMSHRDGSFHEREQSREKCGTSAFEDPERLVKWVKGTVVSGEWEWRHA